MEGRYPNGLLLAITNCKTPSKEEEFNYWYNHLHLPDVTEPGVFRHPIRFTNTEPGGVTDPHGKIVQYAATYETKWEDLPAAWTALRGNSARLRQEGRFIDEDLDIVSSVVYKRLGGEFRTAVRPVRGVLIAMFNIPDEQKDGFSRWYRDYHMPDILDTGHYHTGYFYESLDPQVSLGGNFLAIFETDRNEVGKFERERHKIGPYWAEHGRGYGHDIDLVFRMTARRLWPME